MKDLPKIYKEKRDKTGYFVRFTSGYPVNLTMGIRIVDEQGEPAPGGGLWNEKEGFCIAVNPELAHKAGVKLDEDYGCWDLRQAVDTLAHMLIDQNKRNL